MKTQNNKTINGLDKKQMVDTINAIQEQPSLGRFEFRARNRWITGGENRSTIRNFFGAGREDDSRSEPFEFTNGEPPILLGHNEGANPVEFLLHALAGCVTTTIVLHAAARGIQLEELSTELDGDIDVQGLLGLDPSVSPGYVLSVSNLSTTRWGCVRRESQSPSLPTSKPCDSVPVAAAQPDQFNDRCAFSSASRIGGPMPFASPLGTSHVALIGPIVSFRKLSHNSRS